MRVCAVATVLDTLPHVQRFVRGNLASGADHLFVVLDNPHAAGQPEIRSWLEEQPDVTCIPGDDSWWHGDTLNNLNARQRANANAVKALLAAQPWPSWLFMIDGDEIVQVPRDVIAQAPGDAIRLNVCEAVSQYRWDGDPTWFKTRLDGPELHLLHLLGVIAKPTNNRYFRGHTRGKVGMRSDRDGYLALHSAHGPRHDRLETWQHDELRLLHYESYSGEEFVRKWTAMISSGPKIGLMRKRGGVAEAVGAIADGGLTAAQAEPFLRQLYESSTMDDFATLRELKLLLEVDPLQGTHHPASLTAAEADVLAAGLDRVRALPKRELNILDREHPTRRHAKRPGAAGE